LGINGTAATSVRYADGASLRPSMITSPGRIRAFVYDAQSNLTGMSEWTTTDSTGESGFDASADGVQKTSYGFAYDSANQLNFAQVYEDGTLTEEWSLSRDATGNLRRMTNRTAGTYYTVSLRDKAHRAISIDGPGGTAMPAFDSRGRVASFWYNEPAGSLNGQVNRLLKVNFSYTPDGRLTARAGTVSTNNGADAPISSDEIDKWISNWNERAIPVGPPVSLLGWVKALAASAEPSLVPVIAPWEAVFAAGRYAWSIYLISQEDPVVILVDKLKPEIEAKKCADIPPQMTSEEAAGLLREAASRKGDYTVPNVTITAEDAQILGEAWVGPGARPTSDGKGMVSADGLRVYRFPSVKSNSPYATTGVQANYVYRSAPNGRLYIGNTHLSIAP
jgi:hypothetical protein